MSFADPNGSMGRPQADKLYGMEKLPLMQPREFDEGLVNYMVRNQFTWKKVEFIRHTYSILLLWLVISFLISMPFIHNQRGTIDWLSNHSWIFWLAAITLFLQISFYLVVLGFLATGQNLLLVVYLKMMNAFPANFVWTLLYVVSFTLIINSALAAFDCAVMCYTFFYTAIAVLGLYAYTYAVKNPDFKQLYGYMVPVTTAVVILFALRIFADGSNHLQHFVAVLVSIVMGWIVVFDTQLIFGAKVERGRKYPYQVGMYAMAAYEMYFDLFIHFYLGALNVFPAGEMEDPL
jgi:FtsH-binding integral membrane protein